MQRYTVFLNYPNQNMSRILKNTTRKLKGVDKKSLYLFWRISGRSAARKRSRSMEELY